MRRENTGASPSFHSDQAEGLRRLLTKSAARVVTVVGARNALGSTSVVINLAATWARSGMDVLILDEHLSQNNVANTLALKPRYDLLNVLKGDKSLYEATMLGSNGIRILQVARAMQGVPILQHNEHEMLLELFAQVATGSDVILVDAAARKGLSVCASLSGNEPLVLILNSTAQGITESYAMIKQMALMNGRKSFDIIVNKVKNELEAKKIFGNIQQVARQNLQVRLEYMGYIPTDEKLERATQLCRSVVEAFPGAPSSVEFSVLAQNLAHYKNESGEVVSGLTNVMQRLIRQAGSLNNVVSAIT